MVAYQQDKFLPAWKNLEPLLHTWDNANMEIIDPRPPIHHTVVWHHDESTFYANDRQKIHWVHRDEAAVPYAKGEGASLMVADFVSADYGWPHSAD